MPAPIMNHCSITDEHEAHFWELEGDNFFEGDALQWCDGSVIGVPAEEWTDEEWLAVIKIVPPFAHKSVGEMAVAEMRGGSHTPKGWR